jgi:hypothetical protein
MSEGQIGGFDERAAAHDALEEIAAQARAIRCPVHGTPPDVIMADGGLSLKTCCEALDEAIDAAFPEGDEEDEDLGDWGDEEE